MTDKNNPKSPQDHFPLSDDDIIVSDHAKRLIEQERQFIEQERPMEKLEALYLKTGPNDFFTRVNGAGQFTLYRSETKRNLATYVMLSARILIPFMPSKGIHKPEVSIRFTVTKGQKRFYFARLAGVDLPDGTKSCQVCALPHDCDDTYFFENNHGKVHKGTELSTPITVEDLGLITRLNKHDLVAALRLASKLFCDDIELYDVLNHLQSSVEQFDI